MKLVVFDWNGTLLADTQASLEGSNQTLLMLGAKPISMQEYRATFRLPIADFYTDHVGEHGKILERSQDIVQVFDSCYEPRAAKARTRKNTRKILEWLHKRNIAIVILSNHTVPGIQKHLERLKLAEYIDAVLAHPVQDRPISERGKQLRLQHYMERHKYKSAQTMIVGDGDEEAEIARALGLTSVLITDGMHSTPRLRAEKPDYLITNLGELKIILSKKRRAP